MRVLLKISWEAMKWEKDFWIDPNQVEKIAQKIKKILKKEIELVLVIWWWNIYRWTNLIEAWVSPADSHNMSMLSTVFNWLVLKNFLEQSWVKTKVMDPNWIKFLEKYNKDIAKWYLDKWYVVICTWWTWNPYFTTDTWGVLRALELWCDLMIKATKVDWVYDKDPIKYNDAKFFEKISYDEFISKNLKIMDQTAILLAKEWKLVLKVVNFAKKGAIIDVIEWKKQWSIIC